MAAVLGVVVGGYQFGLNPGDEAYADPTPPDVADFYLDLDTTVGGIQNTRNVPVGTSFNVEVSVDTAALPWEGYQITLDYDDVELDGKLPGADTGWTMIPVNGTNGGNIFVFTSGTTCTPATQGASRNGEDDIGLANWAMTCTETESRHARTRSTAPSCSSRSPARWPARRRSTCATWPTRSCWTATSTRSTTT